MVLNEVQKTQTIPQAINAWLEEKKADKVDLCKISGVGATHMNYICKGEMVVPNKNGGSVISDKYYKAICKAIGFTLDEKKSWKHFNTDNFKAFINQISIVRAEVSRGTIDGDTGAGKTYAVTKYLQKFPKETYVVKCYADENSKEFAINIAETIGAETHGTAGSITKRVCDKLCKMDNAILIIDEAEHIKNKSGYINIIKSLADRLEGKVAFMLSGMDINDILQKASDKHKQNFRQTARRFSKRLKCNDDISDDILRIAEELGFTKSCGDWLTKRIKNFGELEIIVTEALRESELSQEPVSVKLLNSLYQ